MSPLIIVRKVSYGIASKFGSFSLPKFPSSASLRHFRHRLSMPSRYPLRNGLFVASFQTMKTTRQRILTSSIREIPANTSQVDELVLRVLTVHWILEDELWGPCYSGCCWIKYACTNKLNYNPNKHSPRHQLHFHITLAKSGTRANSRHRTRGKTPHPRVFVVIKFAPYTRVHVCSFVVLWPTQSRELLFVFRRSRTSGPAHRYWPFYWEPLLGSPGEFPPPAWRQKFTEVFHGSQVTAIIQFLHQGLGYHKIYIYIF